MPVATPVRSPLDGLVQQIYDDTADPPARWLIASAGGAGGAGSSGGGWRVRAWREGEAWAGLGRLGKASEEQVARAIRDGLMHLEQTGGEVRLRVLSTPQAAVDLARVDQADGVEELLHSAFAALSRPADDKEKRELRQLRAKVVEQEAEIASLHAKLASARANVVRSSQASQSQKKTSPKKPPANASQLQPNVKRRKVVEDEFAGSDSD